MLTQVRERIRVHHFALSALMFLYREVLGSELPWTMEIGRPKTPQRLPVVLTVSEALRTSR